MTTRPPRRLLPGLLLPATLVALSAPTWAQDPGEEPADEAATAASAGPEDAAEQSAAEEDAAEEDAAEEGAAEAPAPPPGVEVAGARVLAEVRGEYLQDEQLVVPLTVRNPGSTPLAFPDLAARPWLVRFTLVLPDGRRVTRYNTPPDEDPGGTVQIAPRGSRRVLLEVPGGGGTPGSYELVVAVTADGADVEVARQPVRVAPARAAAVDLGPDPLRGARAGLQAAWVHQAADGADLYLHEVDRTAPEQRGSSRFLLHLEAPVEPWLAVGRPSEAGSATVAWQVGDKGVRIVTVDGAGVVAEDVSVDAPWPVARVVGRPASVAGGVHVPLWVPRPRGDGGELRLLSIDGRGRPGFPRVDSYDARPSDVRAVVDTSGAARFLVTHADGVDLYTVGEDSPQGPDALPPRGRRVWAPAKGLTLHGASFASLPATDEDPGGLALLLLVEQPGGLVGRWRDLQGRRISDVPPVLLPPDSRVLAAAPSSDGGLGLLVQQPDGLVWREGRDTVLPVALTLGDDADVQAVRDESGAPRLRQPADRAPVEVLSLTLPAPSAEGTAATP